MKILIFLLLAGLTRGISGCDVGDDCTMCTKSCTYVIFEDNETICLPQMPPLHLVKAIVPPGGYCPFPPSAITTPTTTTTATTTNKTTTITITTTNKTTTITLTTTNIPPTSSPQQSPATTTLPIIIIILIIITSGTLALAVAIKLRNGHVPAFPYFRFWNRPGPANLDEISLQSL